MKKTITFSSDSQILAELGERLIATPQTALGELIKNSYDADATKVNIWLSENDSVLNIKDNGNGMSEREFRNAWMRIASNHKLEEEFSQRYQRPLTGSKGVGRFAVRLLGEDLELRTAGDREGLRAVFPWTEFAAGGGIESVPITYWTEVRGLDKGTWLQVSALRHEWDQDMLELVSREVLELQAPYYVRLDPGADEDEDASDELSNENSDGGAANDPGFKVYFSPPGEEEDRSDATREIFDRAVIKLRIRATQSRVTYRFKLKSRRVIKPYVFELRTENLVGAMKADIRFLPKRRGVFAGLKDFDGRTAAIWVRRNGGIRVFDRGFRVPPYGSLDDDWLNLSQDVAQRKRDWASYITKELLPKPKKTPTEALHPALHLPANHQVLGYVSLLTHNAQDVPERLQQHVLQPAMDRQGFVSNAGFKQLVDIVRAGMELLASIDLDEELRRKKDVRDRAVTELQESIESAIEEVSGNSDIPPATRKSITGKLKVLAQRARKSEQAQEEAAVAVETLGLLGIVAAFMTHEMHAVRREIKSMLSMLNRVSLNALRDSDRKSFETARNAATTANDALERHIDYVGRFASNMRTAEIAAFKARAAIREVTKQFEYFTMPRNIEVEINAESALVTPKIPMSVYSGIVINLYTNALKAVLAKRENVQRRIAVEALREDNEHVLRVSDTGIGVAAGLKEQIFEPLFTTTADDGPLGPGIGMGLYIVRRVAKPFGGRVRLVEPADGFSTAIEVRFPYA